MLAVASQANSLLSGWEDQLLQTGKPFQSPSCFWLAGLQAPSLCPSDLLSTHSLTRVGRRGGQEGVGICHSSQGGDLGAAPSLVVWAAFEDALNACFVCLFLRVGCCQAGSTLPLWKGTSTFLPLCCSYWAWNRAWGLGRSSQEWV